MKKDPKFLWVGCTSRRFLMETIRSLEKITRHMGEKLQIIDENEACCGSVLFLTGQTEEAFANREKVLGMLKEKNVKNLISVCPGCTRAFKEYYMPMDGSPLKRVQHITEFLADNLDKLDFKDGNGCTITYHDPCHLARHMDVIEQPRKIIEALLGVKIREMKANRYDTFCCGSGGGMRAYNRELADHTSSLRLLEAKATGAEYLVTSCPFCERSFRSAQEVDEKVRDIKVINLLDLLCTLLK